MSHPGSLSGQALTIWVLTDGKIGDDVQCLAVASALAPTYEKKVIAPRPPWSWLAPWGPIDPRDKPTAQGSVLGGAFPDIVIASGRRAIPYARAVKKLSAGQSRVVILKDPRLGRGAADFIWAPAHDRISGANVFKTLTSPHAISAKLQDAKTNPGSLISALPKPLLGVVLGGPSGGAHYGLGDAAKLAANIQTAAKKFAGIAVTPSRRTPDLFLEALRDHLPRGNCFVWDRTGENPYVSILAQADVLIIAADSHNMMSEALASGCGVYAYCPPGLSDKMERFVAALEKLHGVRRIADNIEPFNMAPLDATAEIVDAIRARLILPGGQVEETV